MNAFPDKWDGFYPGDTVAHDEYGKGWLYDVMGDGNCIVNFRSHGVKVVPFREVWRTVDFEDYE